jgi:cell shape-determining protein MreD
MPLVLVGTIVLCLIDLAFIPALHIQPLHIEVFFAAITAWSLLRSGKNALLAAFVGGLIINSFSDLRFGFYPLFFTITTLMASFSVLERTQNNTVFLLLYCLGISLLLELFILISTLLQHYHPNLLQYGTQVLVPSTLIHTLLILVFVPALRPLARLIQHSEELSTHGTI